MQWRYSQGYLRIETFLGTFFGYFLYRYTSLIYSKLSDRYILPNNVSYIVDSLFYLKIYVNEMFHLGRSQNCLNGYGCFANVNSRN